MIKDKLDALRPPGLAWDGVVRVPLKHAPVSLFTNSRRVVRVPWVIASIVVVVTSLLVCLMWLRRSDVGIVVVILRRGIVLLLKMLVGVCHGRRLM